MKTGHELQADKSAVTAPAIYQIDAISKSGYLLITDMATIESWITIIRNDGIFAFDTETDGLDTLTANLVGLYLAVKPGKAAYLAFGTDYLDNTNQLDRATTLETVLEDLAICNIGLNLKFPHVILKQYNINLAVIALDTIKNVFENIEMPLVLVLSRSKHNGVLIDEQILAKHSVELTQRLKELELKAHKLAEQPFNLASTQQLQAILGDHKQNQFAMKQKLVVTTGNNNKAAEKEALTNMTSAYTLPQDDY